MPVMQENNLLPINFKMQLSRSPNIEYRVQSVSIPGIELGSVQVPTHFGTPIRSPGNITYSPLNVNFIVSETLSDYMEILGWMTSLGHPSDLEQYPKDPFQRKCDIGITLLTSGSRPSMTFVFTNAYPISLGGIDFDVTNTDTQPVIVGVTFDYDRINIQ